MTTLADLLFDEPTAEGRRSRLTTLLSADGIGLHRTLVGPLALPLAGVASAVHRLLEDPVGNIAIRGWDKHRKISEAKRFTAENPGERKVVTLAEHSIKSKQSPTVDVEVGGVSTTVLELDLETEIELASVELVIEGGEIVDAVSGGAMAKVTLEASGVTIIERDYRPADLRDAVRNRFRRPDPDQVVEV